MALGSDILNLLIKADASGAVKEFQKLGREIEDSGDKAATGFKGKLSGAFDSLKAKSGTATAVFDKIGLSSEQAAGAIATAIPFAAAAAGGALVAFAAKGVKAFQETALAAGKFADSTGLSVDSASRYIAVADDIGVGASTIQNAFVKMEKAMATNKAAFGDLIATTKSGGVDLDKTFLNAITHLQGIKDPIERANESSKLFGKGFAEVSQIIGTNADILKKKLASVSDAQVINADELAKARNFQAAMDDLKDSGRDLSITLGQQLVPALAGAARFAASAVNAFNELSTSLGKADQAAGTGEGGLVGKLTGLKGFDSKSWSEFFGVIIDGSAKAGASVGFLTGPMKQGIVDAGGFGAALGTAATNARDFGGSADAIAQNLGNESDALKAANDALAAHSNALLAAFDSTFAVKDAQDQFATSLMAAETAAQSSSTSAGQLQQAYDSETQAAVKVATATVQLAQDQAKAEGKTLSAKAANDILISTLQAMASQASGPTAAALQTLIAKLQDTGAQHPRPSVSVNDQASGPLSSIRGKVDGLDGARASIHVTADTSAARSAVNGIIAGFNRLPGTHISPIATGTKNFAGGLALVGERGPELVMLPSGTMVKNAAETKAMMDGPSALPMSTTTNNGGSINIVFSGLVTDEIAVGREIKRVLARAGYSGVN